jgi:hypothetical protein
VRAWADERAAALRARYALPAVPAATYAITGDPDGYGSLSVSDGPVRLVDARLVAPALGIDSVMQHVLMPSSSDVPHLVSDLAGLPDGRWHFHVDLLPRVDLATRTDTIRAAHEPLTPHFARAMALPDSRPIELPMRLRALSSVWMVGVVAHAHDALTLHEIHDAYADVQQGRTAERSDDDAFAARDLAHRTALFHRDTDIVWDVLIGLIGQDRVDAILTALRSPVQG